MATFQEQENIGLNRSLQNQGMSRQMAERVAPTGSTAPIATGVPAAAPAAPVAAADRPAGYYTGQVDDWYHSGLTDEGLLSEELMFRPELIDQSQLEMMDYYDFDPSRQYGLGRLAQEQASGYQTALSQMAASGGLTAADRMALASSFNRGSLGATGSLLGELSEAEQRNVWETDVANQELMNKAYLQNLELQNLAQERNLAALDRERVRQYEIARDLYGEDVAQERFEKGAEQAEAQAAAMEAEAQRAPGLFEDPIQYATDKLSSWF